MSWWVARQDKGYNRSASSWPKRLPGGYHVFADQDYESRVRGGHNFYRVRANNSAIGGIEESVDILIAMNEESIGLHRQEVASQGVIIFDDEKTEGLNGDRKLFGIPLDRLAGNHEGYLMRTSSFRFNLQ
ncbi:MAG: 2-oxoacid:acceptor oxidoreductase family protein [Dehalococcoidales bacterium]|nr:2-oxoacid:acceptor oxidoreductase family protein [Dehalococcoidales bacterium]